MLNFTKVPASSGLARRLIAFSRLNGMTFDAKLAELAVENLISHSDFDAFPHKFNQYEYAAIQHVLDWNGRSMLLDSGVDRLRTIALASVWIRPAGQTLILSRPRDYADWVDAIREIWPNATVSVFGNQRHVARDKPLPDGYDFSEIPDISADFLITSYGGMIWNDIHVLDSLKYTIVEELSDTKQINHKWEEALLGAFKELQAPLLLQDITMLPKDKGANVVTSLSTSSSQAIHQIGETLGRFVFGGSHLPGFVTNERGNKSLTYYLSMRGYTGHSTLDLLNCFGVSSDLLRDGEIKTDVVTFYDQTVADAKSKKLTVDSGIGRLINRESLVEDELGLRIEQIATDAVYGDMVSQRALRDLMNNAWASLKGQHVKKIVDDLFSYLSRTIVVSDNPELIRVLRLQFGKSAEHLGSVDNPDFVKARFAERNMFIGPNGRAKPLRILIASTADLLDPTILDAANYLILADTPLSVEDYLDMKDLSDEFGIRLVLSVQRGTFEEKVHSNLIKN
jgi:hypothetical protein